MFGISISAARGGRNYVYSASGTGFLMTREGRWFAEYHSPTKRAFRRMTPGGER